MVDYSNFETYLFLSPNKFVISVSKDNNEKIYEKELMVDSKIQDLNFDRLDQFLNDNIFKIEKILNNFVENINLIIDSQKFFSVKISVKKNNYGELITSKSLSYILNDARDYCSNTLENKRIIHVIIDDYFIDNKKYSDIPVNLRCNNYSLNINFICLPLNYLKNLEGCIKKYQISLNRLISMKYIKSYFSDEKINLDEMAKKIINGHNPNEVALTTKKTENKTFFEKFFHFFS
tara:strand:- start:42 stop:743 length:702 start_codon:yes stop_codon:yes gene_type:complete